MRAIAMSDHDNEAVKSHFFPSKRKASKKTSPGNGAKRVRVEPEPPSSPLRRSKRAKSTADNQAATTAASEREPKEKDKSPKRARKGSKAVDWDGLQEQDQEQAEGQREADADITGKKKKKAKAEKVDIEVEVMPLAARTNGLRMCVGAHVSAAKGL